MPAESASTAGTSPMAAATASRVRSSGVGPRPPVDTTRSTAASASRKAAVTSARSSGTATMRRTLTPWSESARASSPPFVSRVSPAVSSLPTASSSAVRIGRIGAPGDAWRSPAESTTRRTRRHGVVTRTVNAAHLNGDGAAKFAGAGPPPAPARVRPGNRGHLRPPWNPEEGQQVPVEAVVARPPSSPGSGRSRGRT